MKPIDWTTFKLRININVDSSTIFNHICSQDGIEKWFLSQAAFSRASQEVPRMEQIMPGDTYVWMWHGSDYVSKGKVLSNNGQDRIEFTFEGCKVSIEVKSEGGVHIVELIQSEIPIDDSSKKNLYVGCSTGWTFYMANMKSILEGGKDLRNKDAGIRNVIST